MSGTLSWIYPAICLTAVFLGSVSQVMLKKAAQKTYASRIREYLNPLVIFGYVIFVLTTLMNVAAYRGMPLSMGPILEATSYVYVTIFGVTIFHEKLNGRKVAALALILTGIAVYALAG